MIRNLFLVLIIFTMLISKVNGQSSYSIKAELGYLNYRLNSVQIDPGPNWKGHYLSNKNGIDLNIVNGILITKKLFTGIGLGYLNFENINGISLFTELEYLPLKTRLTPLFNFRFGYSHLWNQYESGTGTALGEFGLGLNYHLTDHIDVYITSAFLITQQSVLVPARMGFRF